MIGALDAFEPVDTSAGYLRRALQVQRLLANRSQRSARFPDLLVAEAGEDLDLVVLHYDADFDLIASVSGQICRWGCGGRAAWSRTIE